MKQDNYKPLGQYIQLIDKRNRDGAISNLVGVSFEKKIIPSIANTIGTDLSNYRIIKPGQFAYCPVTSRNGERISIALYKGEDAAILSVAYSVFEIIKPEELDADYLMLWVSRPEFDRYARFMSHGSVRELFSWEEMCNVFLPVPSIEEQRRIVSEYQTVERRIKNNEAMIQKLEETAQAIYHHTFVEGIDENNLPEGWRMGCLGEVANIKGGKRLPKGEELIDVPTSHPYIRVADMVDGMIVRLQSDFLYVGEIVYPDISRYIVNEGDIIISIVGTIGKINIIDASLHNANLTENCYKIASDINPYIYSFLKSSNGAKRIEEGIVGGVQAKLPLYNVEAIKIPIPTNDVIIDFNNKFSTIENNIKLLSRETSHLRTLLSLLTSKLS